MSGRSYYAQRHGIKVEPLDFKTLKRMFLAKFEMLTNELYFQEATGYNCIDAEDQVVKGIWGSDPESFFFMNIRIHNLWPIPQFIERYDEVSFFSVVEFLYDYISEPQKTWNHTYYNCGWHSSDYDKTKGRTRYRQEINSILKDYQDGYQLTQEGLILKIAPTGLEPLVSEPVTSTDPKNIDELVNCAIKKYRRIGSTLDEKKDAIRTLGDVLEFLKKAGVRLHEKDESDLFHIINGFDIRHHNPEQKKNYDKELWYDWMFFTLLASIKALLQLKKV